MFVARARRYALDVNAERAEDVVTHQRLLEEARDPQRRPALAVRVIQVTSVLRQVKLNFLNLVSLDSPRFLKQVASFVLIFTCSRSSTMPIWMITLILRWRWQPATTWLAKCECSL